MQLTDEDIIKFQSLFKKEFGMEISREDAHEKGIQLLRLMSLVYKPMTKEEYEFMQKQYADTPTLPEEKIKNI